MVSYKCDHCFFSTNLKYNYNRHKLSRKHQNNIKNVKGSSSQKHDLTPNDLFLTPNDPILTPNDPILTPNDPKFLPKMSNFPENEQKKIEKTQKLQKTIVCEYCNKLFSTRGHLMRHKKRACTYLKQNDETMVLKEELKIQKKMNMKLENEKKMLYKQIEQLLDKVGNTTINQTQNIILNNFGKEDLSHITDTLKDQLLKIPYCSIPKLIEHVHFNDDKPENKNISLTNIRDNKIKVFCGDKWIYKNKDETITDLVDEKYNIIDSHYDTNCDNLELKTQVNYEKFRAFYDDNDKQLHDNLKKECELLILNNR